MDGVLGIIIGIIIVAVGLALTSTATEQETDGLKCDVCDRVNRNAAQFCGKCGGKLSQGPLA